MTNEKRVNPWIELLIAILLAMFFIGAPIAMAIKSLLNPGF